jgi:endo-1,4-beta-xylanase
VTPVRNGTWSRANLTLAIQTHITSVMQHFKGACYSWDVVNEALNDGNGTFRQSVFFQVLGTDYIPIAFKAAAAADPDVKLYYNDFSLEFNNSKTEGALGIVKLIQDAGARIDGVGFQAHMIVGQTPAAMNLAGVLNRFVALGVEVALTELDIRFASLPANSTMIEQQAIDYSEMVNACLFVPKCVGVVVWEFTDKFSWIPSTFPGAGDACPFQANMTRKSAYTSVSALLTAASTAAAMQNS